MKSCGCEWVREIVCGKVASEYFLWYNIENQYISLDRGGVLKYLGVNTL